VSSLVFALGLGDGWRGPRLPAAVDALLTFGGPPALCAVAVAEIVLLRRAGVTVSAHQLADRDAHEDGEQQ
jgi:hypothetical protein